jgi:hypothetical protein
MNHEDLEEQDLVLLTEVPTIPEAVKKVVRPKKNVSIDTIDQDNPRYEFEISYGISDSDDLSSSNEPIITVREKGVIEIDPKDHDDGNDGKRKLISGIICVFLLIMIPVGIVLGLKSRNANSSGIPSQSVGMDSRVFNTSQMPSASPSMQPVVHQQHHSENPTIAPSQPSNYPTALSMSPTRTTSSPSLSTTSPSTLPTIGTSQTPSGMPSPSPSIRPAFQTIAQVLSLSGDKFPSDEESPSYKAVSFLAGEYEVTGSLLEAHRLGQRYALASIYYSMMGNSWRNQLSFVTSFHECDWNYSKNNITKGALCGLDGAVSRLYLRKSELLLIFFL